MDALSHCIVSILFIVVLFVEDHACERAVNPARPLMETGVLPPALLEQLVAVQLHYRF